MGTKASSGVGPSTRFLATFAGILALALIVAGSWYLIPAFPKGVLATKPETCHIVHVSANGRTLVACCTANLRIWDLGRLQEVAAAPFRELGEYTVMLSPDGQTVAVQRDQNVGPPPHIYLWHFATQTEPVPLIDADGLIGFTADSENLVVRHGDTDKVWASATAQERTLPVQFQNDNLSIHPLRDGRLLLSRASMESGWFVDHERTEVWTLAPDLKATLDPPVLLPVVGPVTPSPDGRLVAALQEGDAGFRCMLFEARNGRKLATLSDPANNKPYFSPDGSRLVTSFGGTHTIWEITTLPPCRLTLAVGNVIFSPDGRWMEVQGMVQLGPSKLLGRHIAELRDGAEVGQSALEIDHAPIFAPDGRSFVEGARMQPSSFRKLMAAWLPGTLDAADSNGLRVRQLPDGREMASFAQVAFCVLPYPSLVNAPCCAYFPDGQTLAVGRENGTIEIWDMPPRRPWWIEYCLPILFALLMLLALGHCLRYRKRTVGATPQSISNS